LADGLDERSMIPGGVEQDSVGSKRKICMAPPDVRISGKARAVKRLLGCRQLLVKRAVIEARRAQPASAKTKEARRSAVRPSQKDSPLVVDPDHKAQRAGGKRRLEHRAIIDQNRTASSRQSIS
jgi:hypothetical protein